MAAPMPSSSSAVGELTALTDITSRAWYEADFSPDAGFYVLGYRGPSVPWQSIFQTGVPRDGMYLIASCSSFLLLSGFRRKERKSDD